MTEAKLRRPISVRSSLWAQKTAQWLTKRGIKPNWISWASIGFAALAGVCLWCAGATTGFARGLFLVIVSLAIVARLLCNLFDGLVAVEGGLGEKDGPVWNELPDRLSDALIFIGAGGAIAVADSGSDALGWIAALLAVLCAYVRELGTQLTAPSGHAPDFSGPLAKQQRMWVIALGAFVALFEGLWAWDFQVIVWALWVVILGTTITIILRTKTLIARLKAST